MSEEEISNWKVFDGTCSFYQSRRPKKDKRHIVIIYILNYYISLHYELKISIEQLDYEIEVASKTCGR